MNIMTNTEDEQRQDIPCEMEETQSAEEYGSKNDFQDLAEELSFQELSTLAEKDSKILDIFLQAVVAEEQAELAKSKFESEQNFLHEVEEKARSLWMHAEEKGKTVAQIIEASKKAIGEAIKNMEALEKVRKTIEEEMKYKVSEAIEAKEKSEADLRRSNEIMAMAEIRAEKAEENLKKALEEKEAASTEIERAKGLIKGAEFQLKMKKEHVEITEEKAHKAVEEADRSLKEAIDQSYKLEVKSAADIEKAKAEKSQSEVEATEHDKELEAANSKFNLAKSVLNRATTFRSQLMSEASKIAKTVTKESKNIDVLTEEIIVSVEKDEGSNAAVKDENSCDESYVMESLLARLNAMECLDPASE